MFIKKIELKNFQAHKDTVVDFSAGVNVIVGASDRGKSSIIRALQLVFFNRPGGTAFIRHGAKEARVTITMDDGTVIKRVRTASKNYYQIDEQEPLKAPGRDVPPEVLAICPMQEINFQGQHDSPFMLSETAGECGRMLNKCVDLTVIDRVLSDLNTKKRNASNSLQKALENIKEQKEDCEKYARVPQMKAAATELQDMLDFLTDLSTNATAAEARIEAVDAAQAAADAVPDTTEAREELDALVQAAAAVAKLRSSEEELHRTIRLVVDASTDLRELQENEVEAKAVLAELMGDACPLCGAPIENGEEHA